METFRKNLNTVVMLIGFAGTFVGIGVGWSDIRSANLKGIENARSIIENRTLAEKQIAETRAACDQQIADIRSNGTELSRRDRENQLTQHAEVNRRLELLEKVVAEYGQVRIEIAGTKVEIVEIKERLNGIVDLLKRVNITQKP